MKRRGQKGAVMTFLVIVLVPVLIVASVFADVARVQLSRASADSSADLALYSLMSNYDVQLKENYGLMASSQDMGDDIYSKYADYYKGMMNDADLDDETSKLFTAWLASLSAGDTTDLLQTTVSDVSVTAADNGTLGGNTALMEDQIVQFMKYRAIPDIIDRVIGLVKRIKNSTDGAAILDSLVGADKEKPMEEAKEAFGEAESKLLEDAFHEYGALVAYRKYIEANKCPTYDSYEEYEDNQKKIKADLQSATTIITEYYTATDGMRKVDFPDATSTENAAASMQISSIASKDPDKNVYYLSNADYNSLHTRINAALYDSDSIKSRVTQAASNIASAASGLKGHENGYNEAIYYKMMGERVQDSDLSTLRNNMSELVYLDQSLKVALNGADAARTEEEIGSGWRSEFGSAISSLDSLIRNYYHSTGTGSYAGVWKEYIKTPGFDTVQAKVTGRNYSFSSQMWGETLTVPQFLDKTKGYLDGEKKKLEAAQKLLDAAIEKDKDITEYDANASATTSYNMKSPGIDTLIDDAKDMDDKLDAWEAETKKAEDANPSSETVKQNKEDIETTKNNLGAASGNDVVQSDTSSSSDKMAKNITEDAVKELKERLQNVKNDVDEAHDKIDTVTFGGRKLTEISSVEDMISSGKSAGIPQNIEDGAHTAPDAAISIRISVDETTADKYKGSLVGPDDGSLYKAPDENKAKNGNDPDFTTAAREHWPSLYEFLESQFQGNLEGTQEDIDNAKEQQKAMEDQAKDSKTSARGIDKKTEEEMGSDFSETSGGSTLSVSSALSGMVDLIKKLVASDDGDSSFLDEMRDRILVGEYVMCMFSNATTSWEGCYKLDDSFTNKDYGDGETETPYSKVYGQWKKEDTTKLMANQSLTNIPLNNGHNQAYLGEQEYILFSKGKGIGDNIKAGYDMIFGIREALDLISGFALFWGMKTITGRIINEVANAIALATYGIVPAILTKTVTIIALSTLEASNDTKVLKHGVPIKFFKGINPPGDENWKFAITDHGDKTLKLGEKAAADGETPPPEDKNGFYYSDYLMVYMLLEENSHSYPDMLKRIGDVVQANMIKQGSEGFDLDKSVCYFKLSSSQEVKPLLLGLPYAKSEYADDAGVNTFLENKNWCSYKVSIMRGYS